MTQNIEKKAPAIKKPPMLAVKSSSIKEIGHDGKDLFVTFIRGSTYRYPGVTGDEYSALRTAESIGKHLQVHVMRHKTGSLVPEDAE